MKALINQNEVISQIAETEQVAPSQGLSQIELMLLAVLAGETGIPYSTSSLYSLKSDVEGSGLTSIGFSIALRRLTAKNFIEIVDERNYQGESYEAARLTDIGWSWVEHNEKLFMLKESKQNIDDDIPF